jgi:F-type H+-transporting ATPase subunit gamma
VASLKAIRKRISSVKSTQKITRAMKMVAGARLNRAQQRIVALRPYAEKTAEVLGDVTADMNAAHQEDDEKNEGHAQPLHPLLSRRTEKKVVFVVMSSDRGLCGAFNANASKAAEREWRTRTANGQEVAFVTIGKKSREYLQKRGANILHDFQRMHDGLNLAKVEQVSSWLVERYLKGEFDAVYLIFSEFKSAMTQIVRTRPLLPLPKIEKAEGADAGKSSFIYEPSQKALLERLVPMYVDITIYRALLDSQASEFGARMTAMDAATRNAKDMIGRLTLQYNRARQASITKELMEIIGGAEALKD